MKNYKRIGIILAIISSIIILTVILFKANSVKSFLTSRLSLKNVPQPQRMRYKERFSHDLINKTDYSNKLAKTPWLCFGATPAYGAEPI